jgi:hypothetical protein
VEFPGLDGDEIGDAEVIQGEPNKPTSFFAVAYTWSNETVISYWGTTFENNAANLGDVLNGWTLSLGFSQASQAQPHPTALLAGGRAGEDTELGGSISAFEGGFAAPVPGHLVAPFHNTTVISGRASKTNEPGISRFRVRCFASPRNDGVDMTPSS